MLTFYISFAIVYQPDDTRNTLTEFCFEVFHLQGSHLGLFFKLFQLFNGAFAKCSEKIGNVEFLYRELQPFPFFKIYRVKRL